MKFKKQNGDGIVNARAASEKMTLLPHSIAGEEFDIMKSEACEWLLNQPEIRTWIWEKLKDNLSISYDPESKKWHGEQKS